MQQWSCGSRFSVTYLLYQSSSFFFFSAQFFPNTDAKGFSLASGTQTRPCRRRPKDTHLQQTCPVGTAALSLQQQLRGTTEEPGKNGLTEHEVSGCHFTASGVACMGNAARAADRSGLRGGDSSFQPQGVSWNRQHPFFSTKFLSIKENCRTVSY